MAESISQKPRLESLDILKYPSQPFSQRFCKDVAELPLGFQELCLAGCFSMQMIDILSRALAWTLEMNVEADHTVGPGHSNTMEPSICAKLLHNSSLRPLEQPLCVALIAYHLDAFPKKPLQPLTRYSLQRPTVVRPVYPSADSQTDHCLLWIAVVVEMTKNSSVHTLFDDYRRQWNLQDQIFDAEPSAHDWSWVQTHLETFFWSPHFAERAETCWMEANLCWQVIDGMTRMDPG